MHENMSPLYRELYEGQRGGKLGGRHVGIGHSYQRAAQETIARRTAEARASGQIITGYRPLEFGYYRSDRKGRLDVPIFGQDPKAAAEALRKEQARLAGIQQKQYEAQQADIAKQLKIVQGEKSAVAKMQEDYSNMLIAEAQRRKEAQEQAARDLEAQRRSAQAGAANRLMEGRTANLQIQQASSAPRIGGTQQFRRRVLQQGTSSPYKGLSTIQSGMVNV